MATVPRTDTPGTARSGGAAPAATGGLLSGLAAVVMWGLAPVATRAGVSHLSPLPLVVFRALLAGLVLLPWSARLMRRLDRAAVIRAICAGLLGMVGYNLPVALGIQWLPASTAALVLATEPVWILAMARLLLGERAPRWAWIGSAVALAGVAGIAGPDLLRAGPNGQTLAGLALVLLGTLLFGAYTIVLRPLSAARGAGPATAVSTVLGAAPYLALIGFLSPRQMSALPTAAWGELLFLALGSTVAGMLLWNLSVARIGSMRAGLLLFLEPLVGVTGGLTLLGEHLSAGDIVGGILVMIGVVIAWLAERRASQLGGHAGEPEPEVREHPRRADVLRLCQLPSSVSPGWTIPFTLSGVCSNV
jgi:drug/metabolite transporter (DMT)-like permease